jgi:hypothetical protein
MLTSAVYPVSQYQWGLNLHPVESGDRVVGLLSAVCLTVLRTLRAQRFGGNVLLPKAH